MTYNSHENFLNKKHFELLDGIRAMAILAVLWHHSAGQSLLDLSLLSRGYLGVDLFFVLSGFLITHLLIKEKRLHGKISLRKFYMRRTLRIFPLYYGYLAALIFIAYITNDPKIRDMFSALPYYALYISNWMPDSELHFFHRAWSLAVEEQFYLIWPAIAVLFGFIRPIYGIVIVLAFSIMAFSGFLGEAALTFNEKLTPYRTILLGCLTAILLNIKKPYEISLRLLGFRYTSSLLLACLLIFTASQEDRILGITQLIIHILMALFLASCVVNESNYLRPILKFKLLQTFGIVSYGIYVLHGQLWGPTYRIIEAVTGDTENQSRELFFFINSLLSLAVAWLSYHTYEKYFMNLKKNYEVKH